MIGGVVRRPTRPNWTTNTEKLKLHHLSSWTLEFCVGARVYQHVSTDGVSMHIYYVGDHEPYSNVLVGDSVHCGILNRRTIPRGDGCATTGKA